MGGLAIVAGRGDLPRLLAEDCAHRGLPYRVVVFDGVRLDWLAPHPVIPASFEKPGRLFAAMRAVLGQQPRQVAPARDDGEAAHGLTPER